MAPQEQAKSSRLYVCGWWALFIYVAMYSFWLAVLGAIVIYALLGGADNLKFLVLTLKRDVRSAVKFASLNWEIGSLARSNMTIPLILKRTCQRHPDKVMFMNEERKWTFQQVEDFTNKMATAFHEMGFRAGDNVALFMENRPEYVMMWLGLSKIGAVTALINTNLKSVPLVHCINVVNAKAVIFSPKLAKNVVDVHSELTGGKDGCQLFCFGGDESTPYSVPVRQLEPLIEKAENRSPTFRGKVTDRILYIYTSGTTGLPKAAIITHHRFITLALGIKHMMLACSEDTLYLCLPLYHVSGGVLGVGQTILNGATGVVVSKFSASKFWEDCAKYNCTVAQYIGEICRYLLAQPPRQSDGQHKVRMMFGNGLRPQIWEEFRDRFGIRDLREFYGSTEGNSNLINMDNTVGAVGFIPTLGRILPGLQERIFPVRLIRVDEATGQPLRNSEGLCMTAKPGQLGELVGLIRNASVNKFDGYVDKGANSKKLYHNVFHKGDVAFSSGDLLIQDDYGYLYFKDRTGDTFRWKGENVSTTEIEGILMKVIGLTDVVVYGVEVPGCEGKAGMAAILDPDHKVDLDKTLRDVSAILPSYAVPLFVRLLSEVDSTSTYKLKKTDLAKQAFDLKQFNDPVFYLDPNQKKYVPLTAEAIAKIHDKQIRL